MGSPASDLDRFLKTDGLRILMASGAVRIRTRSFQAGESAGADPGRLPETVRIFPETADRTRPRKKP